MNTMGTCQKCGGKLPPRSGAGAPRKYCTSCRPGKKVIPAPVQVHVFRGGGRTKEVADQSTPPWWSWKRMSRPARAIKFIETFCRTPKGFHPGKLMVLTPGQKEWFEEILSGDNTSAIKSCPRGEGKSTEMSALGLWNVFDVPEFGDPYVPVIATRVSQAESSIYDVALRMIEMEPELNDRCNVYVGVGQKRVHVPSTNGRIFPKANNIDGLQGLDYTMAIMDEIGFQPLEAWQSVVLAQGKRPWSLAVGTGTPGFDRENALWHMRTKVLESKTGVQGLSYTEIAADPNCDINDDDQLRKANPSIDAGYKSIQTLRNNREIMTETAFRTFHLGQWVEGADCWLGDGALETWQALIDPYEFVERPVDAKRGVATYVGVDVGLKHDSTAVVWAQRRSDGRLHFKCRIWKAKKGQTTDIDAIMDFIRDLHTKFDVREVAFDPAFFQLPAVRLANEGLTMVETPQSQQRMAPAFADLLRVIKKAEISVEDDREFETHILNGRAKHVQRGFTLYKMDLNLKIDACYALALCFDRAKYIEKAKPKLVIAR